MRVVLVFVVCLTVFQSRVHSQTPCRAEFTASTKVVQIGDSTVLRWDVEGQTEVYVSGFGLAANPGRMTILPSEPNRYYLVSYCDSLPVVLTLAIGVSGIHGPSFDSLPEDDDYAYDLSQKISIGSITSYLDYVKSVLQDSLQLRVKEQSETSIFKYVFKTFPSVSNELLSPSDDALRARRLAYSVTLTRLAQERDGSVYNCKISVLIEARRRLEQHWYKEEDRALYRKQGEVLRSYLTGQD